MRNLIIFILSTILSLSTVNAASTIYWKAYSPTVVQAAKKKNHTVMIFAMSDGCHWCQQMESTTFKDPAVIKMISENFYPVLLHADQAPELVAQYQLSGVPSIIFLDDNGNVQKTFAGYSQPADMVQHLTEMLPNQVKR